MKNNNLQNGALENKSNNAEGNSRNLTKSRKNRHYMQWIHKRYLYCFLAAREDVNNIFADIKEEMYDGIIINLSERNNKKGYRAKKRIIRKHAEKVVAQSVHKHIGRREGRYPKFQAERNLAILIRQLDNFQNCC